MSWQTMTDDVMKACRDTFTTTFTYTPKVGSPYELKGIFDESYAEVQLLDGAAVQSRYPRVGVRLLDLAAPPVPGDRCTINSIQFRVSEINPDGEAGAILILDKM